MITIKRFPGSSIYYWAIYDFHDARVSGVPVAGTACDEVLSGGEGGTLRSPRNSLVFRHAPAPASRPLVCRYSIRAEDSLYSRIVLTLDKLNFKAEIRQINIRMHADSNHSLQTADFGFISTFRLERRSARRSVGATVAWTGWRWWTPCPSQTPPPPVCPPARGLR